MPRSSSASLTRAADDERHRPEETPLYGIVETYYPQFLARLEAEGSSLLAFVKQEFDDYLKCGRLEHGFLRVKCDACSHEHLVAFSCKRRGFCPSCGARRMIESAAHLVDHVLPEQPIRQLTEPANIDFAYFDQPILGEAIGRWELFRQKSILGRVPMYLVFPTATNDLLSVELPDIKAVQQNYLTVSDIRGRVGVEISERFKKSLDKLAKKNVWIRTAWEEAVKKLEDGTMNAAHVQRWPKGGKDVFSVRVNNIRSPAYRAHLKA